MRPSRSMFVPALFGVATALGACASQSDVSHAGLDGAFGVTMRPDGGQPMADQLVFKDGVFESTVCTRAGFTKSAYTASPSGGATAFAVQCDSPTMGHNDWHGTLVGDHVEGTLVRTPKDGGAPVHFTFAGDRVR